MCVDKSSYLLAVTKVSVVLLKIVLENINLKIRKKKMGKRGWSLEGRWEVTEKYD